MARFLQIWCLTVPRGEEKSALPLELLRHRVFIAEMFTLRKPLSHIILLLAVIHIFTVANPSHIKKKKIPAMCFPFFMPLPHPGPNGSQTLSLRCRLQSPPSVRPTFPNSYHGENTLSRKSTGRNQ